MEYFLAFLTMIALLIVPFIFYLRMSANYDAKAQAEAIKRKTEIDAKFRDEVGSIIHQHINTLAIKERQLIQRDDYGNKIFDKFYVEVDYFLNNVVKKSVDLSGVRYLEARLLILEMLQAYEQEIANQGAPLSLDIEQMSPLDFEHFCADILRGCGWAAMVTQASGDQGIDVIAKRGEVKAVLQCKKYSQPVGNSAVQEIFAGKQFEGADVAAVVSNAPYTPAAKQLANTAGVHLLHYSELGLFAEKLGIA